MEPTVELLKLTKEEPAKPPESCDTFDLLRSNLLYERVQAAQDRLELAQAQLELHRRGIWEKYGLKPNDEFNYITGLIRRATAEKPADAAEKSAEAEETASLKIDKK
jgi:hypothetical protein